MNKKLSLLSVNFYLKKLLYTCILLTALFGCSFAFGQTNYQVKGVILSYDSVSPASFAYIINNNSHSGVIADASGRFVIAAKTGDSLLVKMLGYENMTIFVNQLRNENDSVKAFKKFYLQQTTYKLGTVYVNTFKIKPGEREYMKRVIDRPMVTGINSLESPFTALWQSFSKRGRELTKLQAIFEDLLQKEAIQKKVNTEMLRKLLGEENITYEQFRMYCPEITDDFILNTDGYDLYNAISTAYRNWKKLNANPASEK